MIALSFSKHFHGQTKWYIFYFILHSWSILVDRQNDMLIIYTLITLVLSKCSHRQSDMLTICILIGLALSKWPHGQTKWYVYDACLTAFALSNHSSQANRIALSFFKHFHGQTKWYIFYFTFLKHSSGQTNWCAYNIYIDCLNPL